MLLSASQLCRRCVDVVRVPFVSWATFGCLSCVLKWAVRFRHCIGVVSEAALCMKLCLFLRVDILHFCSCINVISQCTTLVIFVVWDFPRVGRSLSMSCSSYLVPLSYSGPTLPLPWDWLLSDYPADFDDLSPSGQLRAKPRLAFPGLQMMLS